MILIAFEVFSSPFLALIFDIYIYIYIYIVIIINFLLRFSPFYRVFVMSSKQIAYSILLNILILKYKYLTPPFFFIFITADNLLYINIYIYIFLNILLKYIIYFNFISLITLIIFPNDIYFTQYIFFFFFFYFQYFLFFF